MREPEAATGNESTGSETAREATPIETRSILAQKRV